MSSKNILFALLILLLASCKEDIKKKEVIVGMDEEVDSIIAKQTFISKTDSAFTDTSARLNVPEHDSVYRNRKKQAPGLTDISVIKGAGSLKQFVVEIKQFVAINNKQEMAKRVKYPLNNSIKTKGEFFLNYDKLFTPLVKSSLASTDVDKLPRNRYTVMIANGKILIARQGNDFKIIRINN